MKLDGENFILVESHKSRNIQIRPQTAVLSPDSEIKE